MANSLHMSGQKKDKVMVFGVFDLLHEGHRAFLRAAAEHGEEVIAVVARDEMVRTLKQKIPAQNEAERLQALGAIPEVSHAELGDSELGSYAVLKRHQPDVICLGYDQEVLADDLAIRMAAGEIPVARLVRLAAHEPEYWHTTLLTKKDFSGNIAS